MDLSTIKLNLTCVLSIFLFALSFPAAEALLSNWGFLSLAAVRSSLAVILIFCLWVFLEGSDKIFSADWLKGLWVGFFGFGLGSLLLLATQFLTSALIAAIAATLMPVAGVILELLFDKRRLTSWFLLGLVFVLFGGIFTIGPDIFEAKFGIGLLSGILAVGSFAWGSRAAVKKLPKLTALGQTAITSFGMWVCCSFVFLICLSFKTPFTNIPLINFENIFLLVIYSWLGMGVSQLFWIKGVNGLGIGIASFHLNATPLYVMLVLFLLGDNWNWDQVTGALIVIFGIIIAQKKSYNYVR